MMTDLKTAVNPLLLHEEALRQGIELLFYGYRDFTGEADQELSALGLGRAHHRAIYFIGRNPGLTVSQLLAILKITKQSLSRVLQELMAKGYVAQQPGETDRRQRRLNLSEAGQALERKLTEAQRQRIARAYRMAGPGAVEGFRQVLLGLIDEADRPRLVRDRLPGAA
jgi:DNA-binding MarR family transcriptional regulator